MAYQISLNGQVTTGQNNVWQGPLHDLAFDFHLSVQRVINTSQNNDVLQINSQDGMSSDGGNNSPVTPQPPTNPLDEETPMEWTNQAGESGQ